MENCTRLSNTSCQMHLKTRINILNTRLLQYPKPNLTNLTKHSLQLEVRHSSHLGHPPLYPTYTPQHTNSTFLAAMNSSRSDVVTRFVCPFVTKEFFFSLRSYKVVSRKSNGCFNEVSRKVHASFMDVKFQESLKKV